MFFRWCSSRWYPTHYHQYRSCCGDCCQSNTDLCHYIIHHCLPWVQYHLQKQKVGIKTVMLLTGITTVLNSNFIFHSTSYILSFLPPSHLSRIVKLTSPNMNYVMIIGVIGMAISATTFRSEDTALVAAKCTVSTVIHVQNTLNSIIS